VCSREVYYRQRLTRAQVLAALAMKVLSMERRALLPVARAIHGVDEIGR